LQLPRPGSREKACGSRLSCQRISSGKKSEYNSSARKACF
jgi:hypothetical protein